MKKYIILILVTVFLIACKKEESSVMYTASEVEYTYDLTTEEGRRAQKIADEIGLYFVIDELKTKDIMTNFIFINTLNTVFEPFDKSLFAQTLDFYEKWFLQHHTTGFLKEFFPYRFVLANDAYYSTATMVKVDLLVSEGGVFTSQMNQTLLRSTEELQKAYAQKIYSSLIKMYTQKLTYKLEGFFDVTDYQARFSNTAVGDLNPMEYGVFGFRTVSGQLATDNASKDIENWVNRIIKSTKEEFLDSIAYVDEEGNKQYYPLMLKKYLLITDYVKSHTQQDLHDCGYLFR